jgi:hypothetical protein
MPSLTEIFSKKNPLLQPCCRPAGGALHIRPSFVPAPGSPLLRVGCLRSIPVVALLRLPLRPSEQGQGGKMRDL